jgi:hypothetical protein
VENRSLEHWFLNKEGKLLAWREWRNTLLEMTAESAFSETATWWKFVPLVNKSIDPWREEAWPDPWTLIVTGQFCPSAQGLGMFYSLVLSGFECCLARGQIDKETRLLVLLPDNRLLNYHDGELVDMKTVNIEILQTWTPSDLARLVKV